MESTSKPDQRLHQKPDSGLLPWARRRGERTLAGIIGCILPAFPALEDARRSAVLSDVGRFVGSQILALPGHLRLPYQLALTAFEWLSILRWGRPFSALDSERRTAYVALWSDIGLGAPRNFVKLIRGCALLAYHDHPVVLSALGAGPDPSFGDAGTRASRE